MFYKSEPMLEANKIYCCDVLEGLSELDDRSVDLIITSPPYNKTGFNGNKSRLKSDIWNKTIDYAGDSDVDRMPEQEYEDWQVKVLNECFRVLKDDGSMFYNHKVRVKHNVSVFPSVWVSKSKFNCRQVITWDRTKSPNMDRCRYVPTAELIYWLCKTKKNPRFRRGDDCLCKTDVWRIAPKMNTRHPAPFPLAIPDNIIPSIAQGERILVLDPFMGSGTVAVSALKNGCDYIGFDKFQEYVNMANQWVEDYRTNGSTDVPRKAEFNNE